ncbi:MAG TPA: AAA family ATPase, partial [Actinomycetota bacterium]|nr:AAA family ATPase [Actinomycetota bacterium]
MEDNVTVCPVFVGRDTELAMLARSADDGGGLVLVEGEAGIGKSRLLREFASRFGSRKRPVVWARPEGVVQAGPYSLVVDLLDDLAHAGGDRTEAARMADDLGKLVQGAEPPARQIAARIRGLLGQLGSSRAVMIEDLHNADELSQAVLAHLARSARDDGTLLVASYRSEEAASPSLSRLLDLLTRDRMAAHVTLVPLAEDDVREMLTAIWGAPPSDEDLRELAKLCEGIPFFLEELASARASGAGSIPASIARAVVMRTQRLSPEAHRVVRAASLLSGAIDPGLVALICDVSESVVPGLLLEAVYAGILEDGGGRLGFRHALVREAISSTIVSLEAAELHAKIATAIERRYADDLEPHAAALAAHYEHAGDASRAARHLIVAGRRALDAGALEEARAGFTRVLAAPANDLSQLPAKVGLAEVLVLTGEHPEAERL